MISDTRLDGKLGQVTALQDFSTHQHRNAHGAAVYLLEEPHQAFFGYAVYQPNVPGNQVICDAAARGLFTILCELAGPAGASVLEVLFSRSDPRDLAPYRQAFGVKLSFNAEQTAILLPRRLLDQPVPGANDALRPGLETRVQALQYAGDLDTVTHLRRELRLALLTGHVSAPAIAARLDMSPRTLNRRLDAWKLGFQEMLDEARCEFAQQLLANTRLGIGEIATIVGYADPAILTRAFTRWVGATPSDWRLTSAAD
jgi:AraC-like DNA-binding protein